jgi:CheY-like chemotaxis protein
MERLVISGVIERAIETVRPLIEQHRHQLTVHLPSEPLWINADGTRLEQVFINLLTNAAKYTDDGGSIELTAQLANDEIVVRVKDSGIGISAELLPHVFELFMQSERALDRSQGGLGIGLALVQRLVSMHGGAVTVESRIGAGSEFTVRIPLAAAPALLKPIESERSTTASGAILRVLVVDDNVDSAQSLGMLIGASGHTVWTAHDGEAALEVATSCQPHVVFLDIGLPKLDGYAVALRMRELTKGVTLVALTGYGQTADRKRAGEVGFHHHLVKPVDYSVVEKILSDANSAIKSSHVGESRSEEA